MEKCMCNFCCTPKTLFRFYWKLLGTMKILNVAIEHSSCIFNVCDILWFFNVKNFKSSYKEISFCSLLLSFECIYIFINILMLYISSLYLAFFPLMFFDCYHDTNIVCFKNFPFFKGKVVKAV